MMLNVHIKHLRIGLLDYLEVDTALLHVVITKELSNLHTYLRELAPPPPFTTTVESSKIENLRKKASSLVGSLLRMICSFMTTLHLSSF